MSSAFLVNTFLLLLTSNGSHSAEDAKVLKVPDFFAPEAELTSVDCGTGREMIQLRSLSIIPDPLVLKQPVYVSLDLLVRNSTDGNVQIETKLERWLWFFWKTLGCYSGIGTCSYDSVCKALDPDFNLAPNKCLLPIEQGEYILRDARVVIPDVPLPGFLVHGQYRFSITATRDSGKTPVACFRINFSLDN